MTITSNAIRKHLFIFLLLFAVFFAPHAAAEAIFTPEDYEYGGQYAMVLPDADDICTPFSIEHPAVDITANAGSAVLAADIGTVNAVQSANNPLTNNAKAYGNMIRILHPDGTQTLYAHLDKLLVKKGDTVSRGQQIGTVGMTGSVKVPLLHFEVIESLSNTDPVPLITGIATYEQATLTSIRKDLSGGTKYIADYGTINRAKLVHELSSHEHDKYYLDTPYRSGDWQSPTGDTAYNGEAGMNCTGFISYVLRKSGLDPEKVTKEIKETKYFDWKSGLPHSILSGASNYYLWAKNGDLICHTYNSMDDLLKSGKAAKGDPILYYVNQGWLLDDNEDNHLVFFWGNTPSEDLVWHQAEIGITDAQGNRTNQIIPSTYYIDSAKYILIKMDDTEYHKPETPRVTASNTAGGKAQLKWKAVPYAASYEIYRASSKNGKYAKLRSVTGTAYQNVSLTLGKTYYYKVQAVSKDGFRSEFSSPVSVTCRPAQPKLTAANTATGKVKLTWNTVKSAANYEIYRASSKTGKFSKLRTTTGTTYQNTSLTLGKTYYYKVRAVTKNGLKSDFSQTVSIPCRPAQPKVTAALNKKGKPHLTWNQVSGAVSYEIYRSTSKTGRYSKLTPQTDLSYDNPSAKSGKLYYYKVRAVTKNGTVSSFSEPVSVRAK